MQFVHVGQCPVPLRSPNDTWEIRKKILSQDVPPRLYRKNNTPPGRLGNKGKMIHDLSNSSPPFTLYSKFIRILFCSFFGLDVGIISRVLLGCRCHPRMSRKLVSDFGTRPSPPPSKKSKRVLDIITFGGFLSSSEGGQNRIWTERTCLVLNNL